MIVGEGKVGPDVIATFKWRHAAWLEEYGITVITNASVLRISPDGVQIMADSETRVLPADLVVVAGPREPVNHLARELEFLVDELYITGDAVLPRSVSNAIHEGYRIGNRI